MSNYAPPLPPGRILAKRFEIVDRIGLGGQGAVYEARDLEQNTSVAIKEVISEYSDIRQAFVEEGQRLEMLSHPAIPKIIRFFSETVKFESSINDRFGYFLVMEYIPGPNFEEWLAVSGHFDFEAVMSWGRQLLDALHYLHSLTPPVIHKDIKPANLKLKEGNQIIVLDFGLSKTMDQTSLIRGFSAYYSSPEQCYLMKTDARSDLYSLSATLYRLLTGMKPPHAFERTNSVRAGHGDLLEPASALNSQISIPVATQLAKGMALDPGERHQNADEMRRALNEAWLHSPAEVVYQEVSTLPLRNVINDDNAILEEVATHRPVNSFTLLDEIRRFKSSVRCLTFSEDSKLLIGGCESGDIGLLNLSTSTFKLLGKRPSAAVTSLAFLPGGRLLACSRLNKVVELWDVDSFEKVWRFKAQGLEVHSVRFSSDGSKVAWGELGRIPALVQLRDTATLLPLKTFGATGHFLVKALAFPTSTGPVGTIAGALWSRSSRKSSDQQGQIWMWDISTGKDTVLVDNMRVNAMEFSPDSSVLACGCLDSVTRLVDARTGDFRRLLLGHRNPVSAVSYSPSGQLLATSDYSEKKNSSGDVRLWRTEDGQRIRVFQDHAGGVRTVVFSSNGEYFSYSAGESVYLYSTNQ